MSKLKCLQTNDEKNHNNYYTSYRNNAFAISFNDAAMCDVRRTQGICCVWAVLGVCRFLDDCVSFEKKAEINRKRPIRELVLDA